MDHLTTEQQNSLAQLREITNGGDDDVAIAVLTSVDWDLQRATDMIFGTSAPPPPKPRMETFDIDDSHQGEDIPVDTPLLNARHRPPTPPASTLYTLARPLLSVLSIPLHIVSSLLRFILNLLRIPFPQLRFTGLNFYRPLRPRPAARAGGPDRWIRELEEDTGAVCIGRLKLPRERPTASGVQAGSSSVTARPGAAGDPTEDRKLLPDFRLGTYEETLRVCQRDAKIGCIILVSEEHDDTAEFKRSTLTDTTFVKTLYDNDIVVWGGDVTRDREAWTAGEKLQATTYPFVAFLALQPRRTPSSSSSSRSSASTPTLTVLSRHSGPPLPAPTAPTSADALTQHLMSQLLPRVTPFLERQKATHRERELERHLRAEQDRAFADSARRDKERIEARVRAEREAEDAKRQAEAAAREAERQRERDAEEAKKREEERMLWRRWARHALTAPGDHKSGTRLAIRLPSGTRVIHAFPAHSTLTTLYAFVDAQLIPPSLPPASDPSSPPSPTPTPSSTSPENLLDKHLAHTPSPSAWWGFLLLLAYPRAEVPWRADTPLAGVRSLQGGGQIVVEMLNGGNGGGRKSVDRMREIGGADEAGSGNGGVSVGEEDDGYHTEDSE